MRPAGESRYKVSSGAVAPDNTLRAENGWIDMEVRWLISAATVGSAKTVIGRTVLKPGSKHDIHRHPNAEEWEYVVSGTGVKHVGDDIVLLEEGDVVFVPQNVYHALENGSPSEPLVTIWGYSGAASLDEAGYELPGRSLGNARQSHHGA
jgi:mannose-6-phosphate isomerase-like protein (cupin superfamily)